MAKNFSHTKVTTDKVNIKGILSEDGTKITYLEEGEEKETVVSKYFKEFAGQPVDFTIGTKETEDLSFQID